MGIHVDKSGKVTGSGKISSDKGDINFQVDLTGRQGCLVRVEFVQWNPGSGPASAGTIKIGS
jgi:hypothetical protein